MGATLERSHVSESEYLAAEERAPMRSEYIAGEVFAMAGGSERHNRIGDVVRIECGGLAIALSLEDLYEDTGLSID